ncbi:transcriptional repressor NrdR [Georgenia subflava]|uniref:Transcriptional repressor NrdR n=1 Tax=Georgenia subflava TaxID=1622177 RepID=A0A6N7EGA8_9MICO|nr:transcriptional repressor NrdR [Georgenia subflava]
MHCPFCRHADSRVIDSRTAEDGSVIRRRRQCPSCGRRFSTVETSSLTVVKRSGASEPFSRDKVVAGVRKACQGRPVSDDDLALLAQQVEEAVRASGAAQIDAHEIGLAILRPLRRLDEVAYLRFASVYSSFASLEDFEDAIATLRADHEERAAGGDAGADVDAAGADAVHPAGAVAPGGTHDADVSGTGARADGRAGTAHLEEASDADQSAGRGHGGSASLGAAVEPDQAPAH